MAIKKAVQSYWFAPSRFAESGKSTSGFLSNRFLWYSLALSCLQLRRHFERVEFVTDAVGFSLVAKEIRLPYTSVRADLDILPREKTWAWNLGKFKAYELQEEPFVHVDADAFLWSGLPNWLQTVPLFGQSPEANPPYQAFYAGCIRAFRQSLPVLPNGFELFPGDFQNCFALNCGVFGGVDLELIHSYASECATILLHPNNLSGWRDISQYTDKTVATNAVAALEQLTIMLWCQKRGVSPRFLLERPTHRDGNEAPPVRYSHLIVDAKQRPDLLQQLELRLAKESPELKARIDTVLK